MESRRFTITLLVIVAVFLGCTGCGGSTGKKQVAANTPVYPSLSEIPPIPAYQETDGSWSTTAVCWVGIADDAKWSWKLPFTTSDSINWVRSNSSQTLCRLIGEELQTIGYKVQSYRNEYLTRNKRLALQKLVFFEDFNLTKTKVKEGYCYDMELTLKIVNNPEYNEGIPCTVWGRSLLGPEEKKTWENLYRECTQNMRFVPELREALEIHGGVAINTK